MLYTITNSGLQNGRPTSIGANQIVVAYAASHVFTLADFTTGTTPVYSDPEDDALSYIKITSALIGEGSLELSGNPVVLDQLIYSGDISAGNLIYVSNPAGTVTGYSDVFEFDIADAGSNSLSGLSDGVMTMNVSAKLNSPPDNVGDNTIALDYGDSHTFTQANFTTETTPAYSDPEGDNPALLKVLDLPVDGTLVFNGIDVIVNQVITFAEIAAGYLVYNPDLLITTLQSLEFNFAIADDGSGIFTT